MYCETSHLLLSRISSVSFPSSLSSPSSPLVLLSPPPRPPPHPPHHSDESLAKNGLWAAAAEALEYCDTTKDTKDKDETPCALMIVGNSMAGQLAAMATFDVALGPKFGPKVEAGGHSAADGAQAAKPKYGYSLLTNSSAGKERVVRPMTVGGARAGNKQFVQVIDKFYTAPRYVTVCACACACACVCVCACAFEQGIERLTA